MGTATPVSLPPGICTSSPPYAASFHSTRLPLGNPFLFPVFKTAHPSSSVDRNKTNLFSRSLCLLCPHMTCAPFIPLTKLMTNSQYYCFSRIWYRHVFEQYFVIFWLFSWGKKWPVKVMGYFSLSSLGSFLSFRGTEDMMLGFEV